MAANTGVKIFRDFFRESPCRMAYMMVQGKNLSHQYAKNHTLRSTPSKSGHGVRPKTAPILPSNVAQAMVANNLMHAAAGRKRPTTSRKVERPQELPKRPRRSVEDTRKTRSGTEDLRKQPQKQFKSKDHARKPPKQPCKICIGDDCFIPDQWQNLLNVTEKQPSSDGFRHLIEEIEKIRSELISREDMKHITFRDSLQLINEIKKRIDSISGGSNSSSFLNRIDPFQSSMLPVRAEIKARKSVRKLRFEGGRIVERDFAKFGRNSGKKEVPKARSSTKKHIEKKFDEGPLRLLLPFMRGMLAEATAKF